MSLQSQPMPSATEARLARLLSRAPKVPLPGAVEPAPQPRGLPADLNGARGRPCILIIGSEPVTAQLGRALAKHCEIQVVASAAQVLEAAARPDRRPDLILLDVTVPGREGLELCRELKRAEATESVPVVVFTDRDRAEDEAWALEVGADDCIPRPFRLDVVEARIRKQLRIKLRNDLLERYANQDSLTEVANRRRFDLALDAEWRRAIRDGQPLSLLIADVDCFKQFNDLYGHREGDHCLRRVARAMAQVLTRPGDLFARYGGEEFAVILPGTDLDGAYLLGERLREAVMALQIPQQGPDGARLVSVSVGCASARPTTSLACYSLLQAADDQLYLAKHSGRNCVR